MVPLLGPMHPEGPAGDAIDGPDPATAPRRSAFVKLAPGCNMRRALVAEGCGGRVETLPITAVNEVPSWIVN